MQRLPSYLLTLLALIVTAAVITIVNRPAIVDQDDPALLELAREIFPAANQIVAPPEDETDLLWVIDEDDEHLGSIVSTSPYSDHIIGYAGPTPLLIGIDPEGEIIRVILLDNVETPSYVRLLLDSRFLDRWRGMSWRRAAGETEDVDAVSSVTITAEAIASTLRHRLSMIDPDAPVAPPEREPLDLRPVDIGVVIVLLTGFSLGLLIGRVPRWTRVAQLSLSLLFLGVLAASMLSMGLIGGWLMSGSISGSVGLVFLVAAAVLAPILLRRNLYCHFVCPFGSLQELLFRLVPYRLKVPRSAHRKLRYLRYGLLISIGASLLLGLGLDPNDMEPFPAFRPRAAGIYALLIAIVSLILAPISNRPWCTYACPSGALLDSLRRPRLATKANRRPEKSAAIQA